MKVKNQNVRIYMDSLYGNQQNQEAAKKQNRHTVGAMAGRLQNTKDKVAAKKQDAQKRAMSIIMDAYAADKSIDDDLAARASRIEEAKGKMLSAQGEIKELDKRQKELQESYGVEPDSQEQADLELLRKRRDSMKDSSITLTEEDIKRLQEIDKEGMTDYQKLSLENDSYKAPYEKEIKENNKIVMTEQVVMREIGLERLKHHGMVDAEKNADEVMAAASREIIGIVLDDAKDKIDEDMEEVKEDLAEAKEEKKEQEERIEEIQEKADELEAAAKKRQEENKKVDSLDIDIDRMLELDSIKSDVKQEVDNMLQDMKLLVEDVKGSMIDLDV